MPGCRASAIEQTTSGRAGANCMNALQIMHLKNAFGSEKSESNIGMLARPSQLIVV